eukprot:2852846-Alexandrium_andersonii.AAC.1
MSLVRKSQKSKGTAASVRSKSHDEWSTLSSMDLDTLAETSAEESDHPAPSSGPARTPQTPLTDLSEPLVIQEAGDRKLFLEGKLHLNDVEQSWRRMTLRVLNVQ